MIVPEPAPAGPLAATRPEPADATSKREREGGARDFDSVLAGEVLPQPPMPPLPAGDHRPGPTGQGVPIVEVIAAAPVVAPPPRVADAAGEDPPTPRAPMPEIPAATQEEAPPTPVAMAAPAVPAEPGTARVEAEPEDRVAAGPEPSALRADPARRPATAAPRAIRLAVPTLPTAPPAPPAAVTAASPAGPEIAPHVEEAPTAPAATNATAAAVPEPRSDVKPTIPERPADLTLREAAAPAWQLAPEPAPARHAEPMVVPGTPASEPRAVIDQVAVAVGRASRRDVEIRLDPPELGRVQIHLSPVDGGVQAVVLAQRPETHDLLRRHAELLAQELGAAGFGSVSLEFAGGEAAADRDAGPLPGWHTVAPAAVPVDVPAVPPRRTVADGGLDIRL